MEESMSTDARPSVLVHATEELLEEYTFGRVSEPQLGWLEEHLLICPQCQSDLEDVEEYKNFMKAGLACFERERLARDLQTRLKSSVRPRFSVREALSLPFAWSKMPRASSLLVAALLLVLASAAVFWRIQSPVAMAPVATVELIALRGGDGSGARAPSGRPLKLVFHPGDLATDVSYQAEVVNSSGLQMWTGSVGIADQSLSIHVDGPLPVGTYWVRLYTSTRQLLREFGLRVG
jgi:hypothetical protein